MLRTNNSLDLTADQLAAEYDVDASTVRRWATKSRHHSPCPHRKDNRGRLRFDPSAVAEWLRETGVDWRSNAQPKPEPPPVPVSITAVVRWTTDDIATPGLSEEDRELHALHRTIKTCLHVCRESDDLPTPGDFDLDSEEGRDGAIHFVLSLPHRPADQWRQLAYLATKDTDAYMAVLHG